MLVLERLDVLRADLRRQLDLRVIESLVLTRLAQAIADLEHSAAIVEPNVTWEGLAERAPLFRQT